MSSLEEAAKLLEEWDTGLVWAWWGDGDAGCLECESSWRIGAPEQHTPDCLVSRTRAWRERLAT